MGVLTAILVGFGIGLYIDRKLVLGGVGILVGVIIGVIIGFIWIYKEVMSIEDHESKGISKVSIVATVFPYWSVAVTIICIIFFVLDDVKGIYSTILGPYLV